jgi:hypothetical protein
MSYKASEASLAQAPDFFKKTAFTSDGEVKALRDAPLKERMAKANQLKDKGNAAFGQVN